MFASSFNFCLSWKLFISPSIFNDSLAGYRILGCIFFSFSTLNISCQSFLAYQVSVDRSAANLIFLPLYVIDFLSQAAFRIFSLLLRLVNFTIM